MLNNCSRAQNVDSDAAGEAFREHSDLLGPLIGPMKQTRDKVRETQIND